MIMNAIKNATSGNFGHIVYSRLSWLWSQGTFQQKSCLHPSCLLSPVSCLLSPVSCLLSPALLPFKDRIKKSVFRSWSRFCAIGFIQHPHSLLPSILRPILQFSPSMLLLNQRKLEKTIFIMCKNIPQRTQRAQSKRENLCVLCALCGVTIRPQTGNGPLSLSFGYEG